MSEVPHQTVEQRARQGRSLRMQTPRASNCDWAPAGVYTRSIKSIIIEVEN